MVGFLWTEATPFRVMVEVAIAYEVLTGAFLSYVPTTDWQLLHYVGWGRLQESHTLSPE